jgi:hypothetical protein
MRGREGREERKNGRKNLPSILPFLPVHAMCQHPFSEI